MSARGPGRSCGSNIHGPAGIIPSSDNLDRAAAHAIADVFTANTTDREAGGPIVDWPAVLDALALPADEVCAGRVTLDAPADLGGPLRGFTPDGEMSATGDFKGEPGDCQDRSRTVESDDLWSRLGRLSRALAHGRLRLPTVPTNGCDGLR